MVLFGAAAIASSLTFVSQGGTADAARYSSKATLACNKAIASDAIVGHKILATCRHGYILDRQACAKAGEVDWLTGPGSVTVLLKMGSRPQGYTEANFYLSSIDRLCGDPIDPTLTPPPKPMSPARVKHFFS
jgi:hypothetical protein